MKICTVLTVQNKIFQETYKTRVKKGRARIDKKYAHGKSQELP